MVVVIDIHLSQTWSLVGSSRQREGSWPTMSLGGDDYELRG